MRGSSIGVTFVLIGASIIGALFAAYAPVL